MLELDITIIADDGGFTLQLITDTGERYQHYYASAVQCARDVRAALDDNTFADWEGNEFEKDGDETHRWMFVADVDIRRGWYRELTVADLSELDPETCSWNNIRELVKAYRALKS